MIKNLYAKYLAFKLKLKQLEKVAYVSMDIDYFQRKIDSLADEKTLRKTLKKEKEKKLEEQNVELINNTQNKIDIIVESNKTITEYNKLRKDLIDYVKYIDNSGTNSINDILRIIYDVL